MKSPLSPIAFLLFSVIVGCRSNYIGGYGGGTTPSSRPGQPVSASWPKERAPLGTIQTPAVIPYSTEGRIVHAEERPSTYTAANTTYYSPYTGAATSTPHPYTGYGSGLSNYGVSSGGTVHIRGYMRKDGTYVRPHTRSAPDGIKSNNRSYWKR